MEGDRFKVVFVWFLATCACCVLGTAPLRLKSKTIYSKMVQGILQIQYSSQWGTICNTYWNMRNTNIACRQLGYEKGVAFRHLAQGSDPIWLDQVKCNGGETSIDQCSHRGWGTHSCSHWQDVGIVCYSDIRVRLIGGDVANTGRVQLFHKETWKNLCDSNWGSSAANAICRMAGFYNGSAVAIRRYEGPGDVGLSSYSCNGEELSIEYCTSLKWASCSSNRFAGVVCKSDSPNIAFRLVGKPVPHAGRLEMRYYGSWGTVCGHFFARIRLSGAHVMCRMMGYGEAVAVTNQQNGVASRYSLYLSCSGSENSTEQCSHHLSSGGNECWSFKSAWIVCKPKSESKLAVRLADGVSPNEGRVEVQYYGVWGTICWYSSWTLKDADVVCRMLGYRNATWAGQARVRGKGFIIRAHTGCLGNEPSLDNCTDYNDNIHYCSHYNDVGVRCVSQLQGRLTMQVRLEDGRVSFRYGNILGTLCIEGLDYTDVKVICRMLGYTDVSQVYAVPTPSYVSGRVWLSNLQCNGTEGSILNCSRPGWLQTACDYDALVKCKPGQSAVAIRLENCTTPHSGRVGVRYGNMWGTLCNKGLDMNDAKVICRMLGYVGVSQIYTSSGNGTIWLSNLGCNGAEDTIIDCSHSGWWQTSDCNHGNDAAITCKIADAPHFQIESNDAITDSTVTVNLAKAAEPIDAQLKSSYQFMVEKGKKIQSPIQSQSKIVDTSSIIINLKAERSESYIAAELPANTNDASSFTIGDGLEYHGYQNVPLEPGCMYKVYVRIVTMAMDGKNVFGKSSFATFTTRQKTDPPKFQISNSSSIMDTSAVINFLDRKRNGPTTNRWYQVEVEKTEKEIFKSNDNGANHTYITAEIPSTNSTFTIGDGQDYHGYHNAPLVPGCAYRVNVRFITMTTTNGKRIISDAAFVSFTTESDLNIKVSGHSGKRPSDKEPTVIGLSVTMVIVIVALIGYIVYNLVTKKRKKEPNNNNQEIEISDLAAASSVIAGETAEQQYQELNFPSHNNKTKTPKTSTHDYEDQLYQSLSPTTRARNNEGFEEQPSGAYHVTNVRQQARTNVYQIEEPIYGNVNC